MDTKDADISHGAILQKELKNCNIKFNTEEKSTGVVHVPNGRHIDRSCESEALKFELLLASVQMLGVPRTHNRAGVGRLFVTVRQQITLHKQAYKRDTKCNCRVSARVGGRRTFWLSMPPSVALRMASAAQKSHFQQPLMSSSSSSMGLVCLPGLATPPPGTDMHRSAVLRERGTEKRDAHPL